MTVDEMKNKAYQMAKDEDYIEQEDSIENFLCVQMYAVYRLFNSGLMPEQKARVMILRAVRDYKVLKLHREMYLKKG